MKSGLVAVGIIVVGLVLFGVLRAGRVTAPTSLPEESLPEAVEGSELITIPTPLPVETVVPTKTPAQEAAEQITLSEHQVALTSSGFSPNSLTIKRGDTVVFTNQSGSEAQISSNPHPVHTDLPALDSGELKNGVSYRFTFDKAGTVGVHNHFNSSQILSLTIK